MKLSEYHIDDQIKYLSEAHTLSPNISMLGFSGVKDIY